MKLSGTVHNQTFRNASSGWTVLKLDCLELKCLITVVGNFPDLGKGESIVIEGDWIEHAKFGKQFQATSCSIQEITAESSLVPYLSSGLFPGIGAKTAELIVQKFAENTLYTLDNEPEKLSCIRGLKGKKLAKIIEAWREQRDSRATMLFLHSHQIHGGMALKLWKHYGIHTEAVLRENPYILAQEVWGIGFLRADTIALKIGFAKDSHFRIRAGIVYALERAMQQGHCYLPKQILMQQTMELLALQGEDAWEQIPLCLEDLIDDRSLENRHERIWIPALALAEESIAQWVKGAIQKQVQSDRTNWEFALHDFESKQNLQYAPEQFEGICQAVSCAFFLLTGGPGTGKTTTLKGILHLLDSKKSKVLLAAPTGRAAKRMTELTGKESVTLHRLLEIEPGSRRFMRNRERPLDAAWVIVDECSMVDTWMMSALMQSLSPNTHLILIGDPDQLPAIGPGNVLSELLSCTQVPAMRLQKIFRQQGESDIAENAHRINAGQKPNLIHGTHFHYKQANSPENALQDILELAQQITHARTELQVLTPMHRGTLGTQTLNTHLQELLNPNQRSYTLDQRKWRIGDRVMQLKNDYERNIFNGDIGFVHSVDMDSKTLTIAIDQRNIQIPEEAISDLSLAYACTVHKSQGSEYKYVIVALESNHASMLQRNLIYTAITRAKGQVWIVATPSALDQAIRNNRQTKRYTDLAKSIGASSTFMQWLEED